MQLLRINVGKARVQQIGRELQRTGIYKLPTAGLVEIKRLGIGQDFICDQSNHGGVDQAIYVYGEPDYAWWSGELGREMGPGTFGDNLTISELESARFQIGDRLILASVILEVTATCAAHPALGGLLTRFHGKQRTSIESAVAKCPLDGCAISHNNPWLQSRCGIYQGVPRT